jgi:voltage-gated sodium channel
VAFGGLDREAVAAPTGNAVVVTVPVVPPTNFGSFSREGTKEDSLNTKLQLVFKGEHESMLARLDEQYKMLLRRLHIGLTGDEQEELLARLAEEPPLTKVEPKALEASPTRSRSPNLQNASTQTSNEEESHAAGILAQSSPKANATDSSDADQILESLQREKKERVGGFAQAFEDKKRGSAPKASWLENFVHGNTFEALFAMLITANALVMAMEVQYTGMAVGFQIGFEGSNRKASDVWPGAREVFTGLEFAFGLVFVLEVLLKIAVDRIRFIHSIWNWIDFVIVGTWCIDTVIGISSVLNPMMLRLFRLTKLLRVAKLFKSFQAFDSLSILIGSMKAGRAVFFWSVVVLFTAQMASALLMTQLLESYLTEPGGSDFVKMQRHEVYKYFGTFTRAFITTIQLTLGNWVPVCRILLENVGEEWSIFIIIYILFITFAAMRVISAVFIVETQKVASTDEELLILQKERQIDRLNRNFAGVFKELDATGDGMVDWEEFQAVLLDQRVLVWLAALDLDLDQCEGMFSLLDGGDGRISFQNFVKGVQRLKGGAKSVDLIMLMNRQQELAASVAKLIKMVETHITGLGGSIE